MSAARRCDWCGEVEDRAYLRLQLRISAADGKVIHKDFCSQECLRDSTTEAIAERDAWRRQRAEESVAADSRPSPTVMPARAVS